MGMFNRRELEAMKYKPGMRIKPTTNTEICKDDVKAARQEFREETDINVIMRRATATGHLPVRADLQPVFADVSELGDFADVQRRVHAARDAFMALPPELRARFNNQPEKLVEFVQDESNVEEAIKLGLVPPLKVEDAVVPPVPPKEVIPPK